MRTTRAFALSCIFGFAWTVGPGLVLPSAGLAFAATDEEKAGARALAEQAIQEAYPRGDYAQTVDLLRRAEALVHSPTHWLYIGMARVKLGQLVLAQEAFLKASREPLDDTTPDAFRAAVGAANNELEALKPRLSRVTIRLVGVEPSMATVTVDGAAVPNALVGVPMPVDPGERQFQASAPGMLTATQSIVLKEGSTVNIEMALSPDPNAATIPAPGSTTGEPISDAPPAAGGDSTKSVLLYTGIGSAVVGVGGLVGGYLLFAGGNDPRQKADDLYDYCNPSGSGCSVDDKYQITSWDDEADNAQIPGAWIMGGGGLFLAAGATLIVLSTLRDDSPPEAGLTVTPWVSTNGAGLSGTF